MMTNKEAVNWIINITADIGKAEHRDLWHYEQALYEIREILESAQPEIVRCKDCKWKHGAECVRFAEVRPFPDDFCSRAERRTDSNGRD